VAGTSPLSHELALLAACCRWPGGSGRADAVRLAAAAGIDWPAFRRLAAEHRVSLQATQAVREAAIVLPADVAEAMNGHAMAASSARSP